MYPDVPGGYMKLPTHNLTGKVEENYKNLMDATGLSHEVLGGIAFGLLFSYFEQVSLQKGKEQTSRGGSRKITLHCDLVRGEMLKPFRKKK